MICCDSPLIALARINRLEIIYKVFGEIIIPDAVWRETALQPVAYPGAEAIKQQKWIKKQKVRDKALSMVLQQELDEGEAEAIALAIELNADWLIIDT